MFCRSRRQDSCGRILAEAAGFGLAGLAAALALALATTAPSIRAVNEAANVKPLGHRGEVPSVVGLMHLLVLLCLLGPVPGGAILGPLLEREDGVDLNAEPSTSSQLRVCRELQDLSKISIQNLA